MNIEEKIINEKKVYIFESHNLAPVAWDRLAKGLVTAPAVITFDHHTDTHTAFLQSICRELCPDGFSVPKHDEVQQKSIEMCAGIQNESDLVSNLHLLRNDEHIDLAIKCSIISHAYVISNNTNPMFVTKSLEEKEWFEKKFSVEYMFKPEPPKPKSITYEMPQDRIFQFDHDHLHELDIYDERGLRNHAISDVNLSKRVEVINNVNASVFGPDYNVFNNFILDIDLDYFNTLMSISPDSCEFFYNLIRCSKGITIAKESWHVQNCRLEGETFSAEDLLEKMLNHIERATKIV
ncbi:TPA: UPF0489 family protein [Vibrio harveyi]|nr:UPF0489 family protein [Vibrio harveyi]